MKRFDIPLVAEGLTAYAIERQNGWERHQPEGAPTWAERRRFWTDAILQGMARLEGQDPDPKWLRQVEAVVRTSPGQMGGHVLQQGGGINGIFHERQSFPV